MVTIARTEYDVQTVERIITGYAFGTRPVRFTPPRGPTFAPEPQNLHAPIWAYRSYDCVPPADGRLDDHDILVIGGLNANLSSDAFLAIKTVGSDVSDALAEIPASTMFWELDAEQVAPSPAAQSTGWWMQRAWWLMMGLEDVKIATTHKVLHHKRPTVFPLLDNVTAGAYPEGGLWSGVHADLRDSRDDWDEIETRFAILAATRNGATLTRLRMHDIVLWCSLVDNKQLDLAKRKGQDVLSGA